MIITIEHLQLSELKDFLLEQAYDSFPSLKDENRLNMLAEKWYNYAEFCTSREEKGKLIGMIAFYANQPESGIVYFSHVYVASHYRCKGVFKKMLEEVEHLTQIRGYHTIKLEVQKGNITALLSYEKIGFSKSCVSGNGSVFLTKTF